jgi:membrane protease YdiL (CAAX protease family)
MNWSGDSSPLGGSDGLPEAEKIEPQNSDVSPLPESVACWRCGRAFPENLATCPVCRAKNRHYTPTLARAADSTASDAFSAIASEEQAVPVRDPVDAQDFEFLQLKAVFKVFMVLLATSVVQGLLLHGIKNSAQDPAEMEAEARATVVFAEVADTIVVFAALFWIGRPPRPPVSRYRILGGIAGIALLLAAFGVNVVYHRLLQLYIFPNGVPDLEQGVEASLYFTLLTTVLQPAIVEELFFRYLLLGHLRRVTNVRSAVWLSSIAFGMAHLGNPVAIPVLITVGVALGYARVWSGAIWLPMLLHALHNGMVFFLE